MLRCRWRLALRPCALGPCPGLELPAALRVHPPHPTRPAFKPPQSCLAGGGCRATRVARPQRSGNGRRRWLCAPRADNYESSGEANKRKVAKSLSPHGSTGNNSDAHQARRRLPAAASRSKRPPTAGAAPRLQHCNPRTPRLARPTGRSRRAAGGTRARRARLLLARLETLPFSLLPRVSSTCVAASARAHHACPGPPPALRRFPEPARFPLTPPRHAPRAAPQRDIRLISPQNSLPSLQN